MNRFRREVKSGAKPPHSTGQPQRRGISRRSGVPWRVNNPPLKDEIFLLRRMEHAPVACFGSRLWRGGHPPKEDLRIPSTFLLPCLPRCRLLTVDYSPSVNCLPTLDRLSPFQLSTVICLPTLDRLPSASPLLLLLFPIGMRRVGRIHHRLCHGTEAMEVLGRLGQRRLSRMVAIYLHGR